MTAASALELVAGRVVACVAAASLAGLAFAASSEAAVGDIAFAECIADEGGSGCADTGTDPLDGAGDVEVSPDGSSVYIASVNDDSLSHYSRNAAGQLSFQGCIADAGGSGCVDVGPDALDGASDVEVSPDGTSVYIVSLIDDSLSHYSRNAAGQILFQGCIADDGQSTCFDTGTGPLEGASGVAVSPDGSSVYVASSEDDSLSHYARNAAGQIFFQGCIADGGQAGCFDTGTDPLDGARDVVVSPDGSSVYVASETDDSLTHYARNAAGQIFFQGCIADDGKSGCFDAGPDPLDGARDVEVSPDGSSVYVASRDDNSLTDFSRNAAGHLSFRHCVANDGQSGCFDPPSPLDPLTGASDVVVSPDGISVYVASLGDSSLTHFSRNAAGQISLRRCVAEEGRSGCVDPPLDPLSGANGVVVSPGGSSVYVVSSFDDSVTRFSRDTSPETTITKRPRRKTTRRRATFRFVTDTAGATFECKLDRRPFGPCSSPYTKRVRSGKHRFQARAIFAGVTDATPDKARWTVKRGGRR